MRAGYLTLSLLLVLTARLPAQEERPAALGRPARIGATLLPPSPPLPEFDPAVQPAGFETSPLALPPPAPPEPPVRRDLAPAVLDRAESRRFDAIQPFAPPEPDPAPSMRRPVESRFYDSAYRSRTVEKPAESKYTHTSAFGERIQEWLDNGFGQPSPFRSWFQSDHSFDYFASPVTNPFFFEDPRSLTEVRPIFFFQTIPDANPDFMGGNALYFGTQARVAINEKFSLVLNKLGGVIVNPGSGSAEPGGVGFAEIHLGPKFTFIRDESSRFLAAAGLTFQIPAGPASVYQDTGRLSLVPYVSVAKNFCEMRFGSFNFMNTTGFSLAADGDRTNFLYTSFHLDWDIANRHKLYPLIELSWFQYTRSGASRPLTTEGRDLANIGASNVGGRANLHVAVGARYRLTDNSQFGIATEFPISSRKDMTAFRLGVDWIWRY